MNWTDLLSSYLSEVYKFIDGIKIPGIGVSFLSLMFGCFGAYLSIVLLQTVWGLGDTTVSKVVGFKSNGGNNKKIKTSNRRKGDKK